MQAQQNNALRRDSLKQLGAIAFNIISGVQYFILIVAFFDLVKHNTPEWLQQESKKIKLDIALELFSGSIATSIIDAAYLCVYVYRAIGYQDDLDIVIAQGNQANDDNQLQHDLHQLLNNAKFKINLRIHRLRYRAIGAVTAKAAGLYFSERLTKGSKVEAAILMSAGAELLPLLEWVLYLFEPIRINDVANLLINDMRRDIQGFRNQLQ